MQGHARLQVLAVAQALRGAAEGGPGPLHPALALLGQEEG